MGELGEKDTAVALTLLEQLVDLDMLRREQVEDVRGGVLTKN